MEKTIVSYDKEQGITIDCTQIKENEHKQAREEIEKLHFSFETIDADSFRAVNIEPKPSTLSDLETVGYSF